MHNPYKPAAALLATAFAVWQTQIKHFNFVCMLNSNPTAQRHINNQLRVKTFGKMDKELGKLSCGSSKEWTAAYSIQHTS